MNSVDIELHVTDRIGQYLSAAAVKMADAMVAEDLGYILCGDEWSAEDVWSRYCAFKETLTSDGVKSVDHAILYVFAELVREGRFVIKSEPATDELCDQKSYNFSNHIETVYSLLTIESSKKCNGRVLSIQVAGEGCRCA